MQASISDTPNPLCIAVLGCGSRGRTYSRIAASLGGRYEITGAPELWLHDHRRGVIEAVPVLE